MVSQRNAAFSRGICRHATGRIDRRELHMLDLGGIRRHDGASDGRRSNKSIHDFPDDEPALRHRANYMPNPR
jgi:hypothetical protein